MASWILSGTTRVSRYQKKHAVENGKQFSLTRFFHDTSLTPTVVKFPDISVLTAILQVNRISQFPFIVLLLQVGDKWHQVLFYKPDATVSRH